jgi:hypothetical protein
LLLSVAGGAAGLLTAKWGVKLLVAMSPAGIARIEESNVDGRVFGFTCVVVVFVGLIAGIFPAPQASKADVNETLKAQSTAAAARSGHDSRQRALPALMIAELAMALILLVGAGLMIKSFMRLLDVPKGFNPDGLFTLLLRPGYDKYPQGSPQHIAYYQEALARVQALPGVESACLTSFLPLTGPTVRIILQIVGFDRSTALPDDSARRLRRPCARYRSGRNLRCYLIRRQPAHAGNRHSDGLGRANRRCIANGDMAGNTVDARRRNIGAGGGARHDASHAESAL